MTSIRGSLQPTKRITSRRAADGFANDGPEAGLGPNAES